jgi:TetR/AcrR family transcriptional regulator
MMTETLVKRDREETMARILAAATGIFLEKGFADTSLSEIAKAADITKSLIHHHFGSKQDLWIAVKESAFQSFCRDQMELLEANEDPKAGLLQDSIEGYFRFLVSKPEVPRLLAWISLEGEYVPGNQEIELNRQAVKALEAGQKNGQLKADLDPKMILAVFSALSEYWLLSRERMATVSGLESGPDLDEKYLRNMLRIFMDGVKSDEG